MEEMRMSDELKDFDKADGMGAAPTLTFEPFKEEKTESSAVEIREQKEEVPVLDESSLSPDRKSVV